MDLKPFLAQFKTRFIELESALAAPDLYSDSTRAQQVTREHNRIKEALEEQKRFEQLEKSLAENRQLIASNEDKELAEMAQEELPQLEKAYEVSRQNLLGFLVPADPNDSRHTIVEIRAGTGGDEAGIFAADLYRMYARYAERNGLKIENLDSNPSEMGGYKEIIFMVTGEDVYKQLRYESGVHRVQRVPATESQGRIHTSAATVAVLPEAKEVDLVIKHDDLRIQVCRAGGHGGQGVNTTDSAVQILHIPSGTIVRCQDTRSQIKNKERAMNILRSRLLERKQAEEDAQYASQRKSQIGSGDRNEKIRTYNYPQNRITDHRIQHTIYNLSGFMDGDISEMIEKLQAHALNEKLAEMGLSAS
jgi:peptide chain release factor 1